MLDLHDEREHVSMRIAAVAVESALRRVHGEAGVAVGVERTVPLVDRTAIFTTRRFERNAVALDNALNWVGRANGVLVEVLVNQVLTSV